MGELGALESRKLFLRHTLLEDASRVLTRNTGGSEGGRQRLFSDTGGKRVTDGRGGQAQSPPGFPGPLSPMNESSKPLREGWGTL